MTCTDVFIIAAGSQVISFGLSYWWIRELKKRQAKDIRLLSEILFESNMKSVTREALIAMGYR